MVNLAVAQNTTVTKHTGFHVVHHKDDDSKSIIFKDGDLLEVLRAYTDLDELYEHTPEVDIGKLFSYYEILKSARRKHPSLTKVVDVLTVEHSTLLDKIAALNENSVVTFQSLVHVFIPGTKIWVNDRYPVGGTVQNVEVGQSFGGRFITINYQTITTTGKKFAKNTKTLYIGEFKGTKPLKSFSIQILSDEKEKELTERGRIFRDVAIGPHYYCVNGHMEVMSWYMWSDFRATGRCMIDGSAYSMFKPGYDEDRNADEEFEELPDDKLWQCSPYVKGFSFVTKQWGRFPVDNLAQIQFNTKAFEQLVLDESKKQLIKALVVDSSSGFKDIIHGKGGGCIFLLHGEPGVGKTLSAEAVAELLQRPLYSVGVGELGTDTSTLENSLRQILDVAQLWNAVVLIDEADIFLEERTEGDILRNAMVGIFLRLLEYHQGVLFLTTNRVKTFDKAFHSRISIALKYSSLTKDARKSIWDNLLKAAGLSGLDTDDLSNVDINGRQIKNTIRLAQGLARQNNVPVSREHIMMTIEIAKQFQQDITGN